MSAIDINERGAPTAASPRVLLIDDEHDLLEILSFELNRVGFDVTAVDNGAAGVEAARRQRFSAVITDLRMRGMDGLATMKALKQLDADLPVIVATGFVSEVASVAFGQQGAFGLILKPFELEEIFDLVQRAVDERENHDQRESNQRTPGRPKPGTSGIRARKS